MNNIFELVNYNKLNTITKLKLAIAEVKGQINDLEKFDSKELSTMIYSVLYKNKIDSKIINTYNLGYDTDYYFTMVPMDDSHFYLLDLYANYMVLSDEFMDLQRSGIKLVGDSSFKQYLQDVTSEKYSYDINQVYSKYNIKRR